MYCFAICIYFATQYCTRTYILYTYSIIIRDTDNDQYHVQYIDSLQVGQDANDFSLVPIESTSDLDDGLYGISLKAESELINDDSERSGGL